MHLMHKVLIGKVSSIAMLIGVSKISFESQGFCIKSKQLLRNICKLWNWLFCSNLSEIPYNYDNCKALMKSVSQLMPEV